MGLKIRRVREEDLESFVKVYREAYRGLEEYAYTDDKTIRWYFRWLRRRDPEGFFVAEADAPIGFVHCDTRWTSYPEGKKVGEIHELIVHPDWMGKGVGKTLVLKAIEYSRSRGRDMVELWVGCTNYRAINFYKKLGFEERGSSGIWIKMTKKTINSTST